MIGRPPAAMLGYINECLSDSGSPSAWRNPEHPHHRIKLLDLDSRPRDPSPTKRPTISATFIRSRSGRPAISSAESRGYHSAHISRETRAWLDTRPPGRFDFTFTPKHGSWLNLIEGFFSKFARSVLRHIRVTSKHELKQRIMAGIDDVNRHPVMHTWSYKLAEAA